MGFRESVRKMKAEASTKDRGWYTAFYCFAESIREFTNGAINYKILYALVGTKGDYVNHENPSVRVSTAPAFSRLIHSRRYVADLAQRLEAEPDVFKNAAQALKTMLMEATSRTPEHIFRFLQHNAREDLEAGLENESVTGREVQMQCAHVELANLFASCEKQLEEQPEVALTRALEGCFQVMALGRLEKVACEAMAIPTPLEFLPAGDDGSPEGSSIVLVNLTGGRYQSPLAV